MRSRDGTSGELLALAEHESQQIMTNGHAGERIVLIWRLLSRERTNLCIHVYISRGTRRVGYDVTNALGTIYKTNRSATEVDLGRRESITYPKGECLGLLLPSSGVRAGRLAL